MKKFFERQKLVKKGMACGKIRRRQSRSPLLERLENGALAKVFIFAAFLAGLAALIFSSSASEPVKALLISSLILGTAIVQMWLAHGGGFQCNSRVLLVFGVFLLHLVLMRLPIELAESGVIAPQYARLLLPVGFAPLVLCVLLGRSYGLFAAVFTSLWASLLLDELDPVFVVMSLICGFIAVFVTMQVRRRSRLIRAGVYIGLATWLLAFTFGLIGPVDWLSLGATDWQQVFLQSLLAVGTGIFTAMLVGGMLPILESLFGITTDISWLELADLNHPLLKRMTIEAPGTYHHSLVVANLAESAAEAVGANPIVCRVCAYFHDIGKLVKPNYFAENMHNGENPHDALAPTMSALIIIAHVKEGVDLALKHKLNDEIVDAIQQHHGTSLVSYFYNRALKQQREAREAGKITNMREEDVPEVSEKSFRYQGPKPQTKEIAIISLADAVESATRSLDKPSPQKLEQLINEIITSRILDGLLDECDLTMRDLKAIAEKFLFTLRSMMHSRIAYPKDEDAQVSRSGRADRQASKEASTGVAGASAA